MAEENEKKKPMNLGELSDAAKAACPVTEDDMFPIVTTSEEDAFGFTIVEIPNPKGHYAFEAESVRAAVVDLGQGLRAGKMADPNGDVSYAIWNEKGQPVQAVAGSIRELQHRFPG